LIRREKAIGMDFIHGKRAFITGGSEGIGRATALELARRGAAAVVICARRQQPLDDTVKEMTRVGRSDAVFAAVSADVTNRAAMIRAANEAILCAGGIDLLIANSGFAKAKAIADADEEHFRSQMDVNFFGHVNTVQAFQPHFRERGRGDIVLVSSVIADMSVWGYGAYSATKMAIRGFAEALRQEMMLEGITVKLFLPPTTDTPGLAKENEDKPPITMALEMDSAFNTQASAEDVAKALIDWLPRTGFVGYAGRASAMQAFLMRHAPSLARRIADGEVRTAATAKPKNR
jgi:3-dehydrosphinganine reductase